MADDNDDSWLYGGPDEGPQHVENSDEKEEDVLPVKNGENNKTYENDEHDFEVNSLSFKKTK